MTSNYFKGDYWPTNNGFIAKHGSPNNAEPFFYWDGNVIDPTSSGYIPDMHGTDLTRDDVIIPAENPNFP